MKKRTKAQDFIRKHEYPGGKKALDEFIKSNLKYPEEALKLRFTGDVWVEYELDFNGSVLSAKSLKKVGNGLDEEAVRLVKLLKFSPQNNHGVKISSKQKIKIQFKLPEIKPQIAVNYAYTQPTTKVTKAKPNPKKVYSYSIKIT